MLRGPEGGKFYIFWKFSSESEIRDKLITLKSGILPEFTEQNSGGEFKEKLVI